MANPQPNPFFKMSTEYYEALAKIASLLPSSELQILMIIHIKTWGQFPCRKEAVITMQDIIDKTLQTDKANINRAINGLLDKNMITRTGENNRKPVYSIQKDYEKWILKEKKSRKTAQNKKVVKFDNKNNVVKFDNKPPEILDSVVPKVDNEKIPEIKDKKIVVKFDNKQNFPPININRIDIVAESDISFSLFENEKIEGIKKEPKKNDHVKRSPKKKIEEAPLSERIKICEHFKNVTGAKSCDPEAKGNKQYINARWNEGFRTDDFIAVIDYQYKQWKDDSFMQQYIRISTFFNGEKFEGYLNNAYRELNKQKPRPQDKKPDFDIILAEFEKNLTKKG